MISRSDAVALVAPYVLDKAVAAGALHRPFARAYVLASRSGDPSVRRRAALASVPGSYLSHTDALAAWNMLPAWAPTADDGIHLAFPRTTRHPRSQAGLVIHRRSRAAFAGAVDLRGVGLIVSPAQALVDSWRLLGRDARRAAVIDAVRDRRLRVDAIRAALDAGPRIRGAAELRELLSYLAAGCESELEIWGLTQVFDHPSLPPSATQYVVRLPGLTAVLDRAYADERVGIELDGAAYHFHPAQRERDMRRDEALAAAGWVVLRFSWRRLYDDPVGARERIRAVPAARRAQLVRV